MGKHRFFPSSLSLGWRVNEQLEPAYWTSKEARPGKQSDADLVLVPSDTTATHTALIAQSGSGKSYFLGRLVEELVLQTRARCVIIDPNSDFYRVHEAADESTWRDVAYRRPASPLPTERSRKAFLKRWSPTPIRVTTMRTNRTAEDYYKPPRLYWPSVPLDAIAEALAPAQRSDLNHCHAVTQQLARFLDLARTRSDLHNRTLRVLNGIPGGTYKEKEFNEAFPIPTLVKRLLRQKPSVERLTDLLGDPTLATYFSAFPPSLRERVMLARLRHARDTIFSLSQVIGEDVRKYYFSRWSEFERLDILSPLPESRQDAHATYRLDVLDLASFPSPVRPLAVSALLAREWARVKKDWLAVVQDGKKDDRVPTFVLVDEAHNLAPADPRTAGEIALRDQLRTIVAEGRKYGLFLIVASQRPDKLDQHVIAECENRALMRLSGPAVLQTAQRVLGLEDVPPKMLAKSLEFGPGRVLLYGNWSPHPTILYAAARRTAEGGRNLRSQAWARAPRPH